MKFLPFKKHLALEVFSKYRITLTKLHELSYLFWECTLKCNLECIHCGSDCKKETSIPDMPLGDFINVLDGIKKTVNPNKTIIVLTGGEPLLRNDLEECGLEFYKRGFPWGMVTNGFAFSERRFEKLVQCGLRSITISLDGLESSHNWLRGKNKSFDNALKAVICVAKYKDIVYDVVTCVNQKNFDELNGIKDLLVRSGVKNWRLFNIFPKGRAKDNALLDISNGQFVKLMEFIMSLRKEGLIKASYGCEGFLGSYEGEVRDGFFFCRAGINVGSVLADGSISACPSLRGDYIQGNIYNDDFTDVWENKFDVMRNRKWMKTGICEECKSYNLCGGNGLHLRDEKTGELLRCQYEMLKE